MELEDLERARDLRWQMGRTRAASGSLFEGWVQGQEMPLGLRGHTLLGVGAPRASRGCRSGPSSRRARMLITPGQRSLFPASHRPAVTSSVSEMSLQVGGASGTWRASLRTLKEGVD